MKSTLADLSDLPLCLAPMVGLTHVAMREALRYYMPQGASTIWPTEMLSSRRLPHQKLDQTAMTLKGNAESGLVPQILGNKQKDIEVSIQILKEWGAVGIDINMGCPVKKALRHNYGVSLMGDADYAEEVVSYAVEASDLPVSVKFRAGRQNDLEVLKNFATKVERAGASWVTLHPRTAEQKRRGRADWAQIAYLKKILDIEVIGNGDVQNLEDFLKMKEQTSCDMVMVGRALTARPWLLWQVGEHYSYKKGEGLSGEAPRDGYEEGEEFARHLKRFVSLCFHYFEKEDAIKKIRFYMRVAHPWLMFGHDLTSRMMRPQTEGEFLYVIESFFLKPQKMMQTTLGAY